MTLTRRITSLQPWQITLIAFGVLIAIFRILGIHLEPFALIGLGPVTLAQASLNAADDIDRTVIDEFRKSGWLFDNMQFDDVVNPSGGGASMVYGYDRLVTQPTAAFRAINAEYTPQEATKEEIVVSPKPFGGSFQIDRVLDLIAASRETVFQLEQKIKAAVALFNDAVINGDSAVDANSFDGLDKALTGSTTEIAAASLATAGTWSGTFDEAKGQLIMDDIDQLLGTLDGPADAIIANKRVLAKLRGAARRAGYLTQSEDAFGRQVTRYNGVYLLDPGAKPGSTTDVIPVSGGGLTDIYAVRLGLDGLHAITIAPTSNVRQRIIRAIMPDFETAGAVKTGEVEIIAAIALKATKAAAVARDVDLVA